MDTFTVTTLYDFTTITTCYVFTFLSHDLFCDVISIPRQSYVLFGGLT
jgi:hypothetical protein